MIPGMDISGGQGGVKSSSESSGRQRTSFATEFATNASKRVGNITFGRKSAIDKQVLMVGLGVVGVVGLAFALRGAGVRKKKRGSR